jgi:hypothetical protein
MESNIKRFKSSNKKIRDMNFYFAKLIDFLEFGKLFMKME